MASQFSCYIIQIYVILYLCTKLCVVSSTVWISWCRNSQNIKGIYNVALEFKSLTVNKNKSHFFFFWESVTQLINFGNSFTFHLIYLSLSTLAIFDLLWFYTLLLSYFSSFILLFRLISCLSFSILLIHSKIFFLHSFLVNLIIFYPPSFFSICLLYL
jgi:hypothetical protein